MKENIKAKHGYVEIEQKREREVLGFYQFALLNTEKKREKDRYGGGFCRFVFLVSVFLCKV